MKHLLGDLVRPDSTQFLWASGMEDTFVPQVRRGHRALDEYELMGHYEHWREDLGLARELGVQAFRWGVPWYRVEPESGTFDWSWTDQVIPYLVQEVGVLPIIDLMHYGCPLWLEREFVNPDYPQYVARYAHAFAQRYASMVSWYTPLNEPLINSEWCGRRGMWPPYLKGDRGYLTIMLQLCRGIARTVEALRSVDPTCTIVHVEAASRVRGQHPGLAPIVTEESDRAFLSYELISGRVDDSHSLYSWLVRHGASLHQLEEFVAHPVPLDIVGLNFYPQWGTVDYRLDSAGRMATSIVEKNGIGFASLLEEAYARYGRPVMVTETSARGNHATRSRWLRESIAAMREVRARGVPVVGYTWFPMTTMVEWPYRFGRRPVDQHYVELGLFSINRDGGRGPRWVASPLVEEFQGMVTESAEAIGPLVLPEQEARMVVPAAQ